MTISNDDIVLDTAPLGTQWPTTDPFLFCAHHLDGYPAGDGNLRPAASLKGRNIGSDFAGIDGWNMYHGSGVPGFPQHPHRGFETVTYVRTGTIDNADSLGATARFGEGDTQWVTAGRGIVHSEMLPLLSSSEPNPLELFQIWLNLPAANKMVDAHFTMLWSEATPVVQSEGAAVTVITGELGGHRPPTPPNSWAAQTDADVAIWHVRLDAAGSVSLPPARFAETVRTVYCFHGGGVQIGSHPLAIGNCAIVKSDRFCVLTATDGPVECLVLQGRPIGEPVARYGPFVMNTEAEIQQAFGYYRRTEFGGWPWPADDPTNGDSAVGRFARYPDGRYEFLGNGESEVAQVANA